MIPSPAANLSPFLHISIAALLLVLCVPLEGRVWINEIMASNGTTLADEDGDYEDWIELHNPGSAPVDLSGWGLSDDFNRPFRWTFSPGVTLKPGEFLLVWASGKDRPASDSPGGHPHTNFRIDSDGEEILLTRPDGLRVDEIPPTSIPRDVSFGRSAADTESWVFFALPTPGKPNGGPGTHHLPETVTFSSESRLFSESLTVALSGAAPDQEIYYTTDNTRPDINSLRYEAPLLIDRTTTLRARVSDAHGATGEVETRHFIQVSPSLAAKRSNLPIIVMDAHGASNQELNTQTTPLGTPRVAGYLLLFDRDGSGISDLSSVPDLATRQGLRFRGSSSRSWPKRHYSVELWDESDHDRSLPLLGMAADSDWILYNGYQYDRAGIRNSLAFDLSRAMGRWAPETRFAEVYVNHDGGVLGSSPDDYMGYYAVVERIKQGDHRLGMDVVDSHVLPPDGPIEPLSEGPCTGGYIFKADRSAADEYRWNTDRGVPGYHHLTLSRPKLHSLDGGPYSDSASAANASLQVDYLTRYVQAMEDALYTDHASGFDTREYLRYIDRDSFVDHLIINAFTKNVDALRLSAFFHKPQDRPLAAGPVWDFDRSMGSFDSRDNEWNTWHGTGDATRYFDYRPEHAPHWWEILIEDPDFEQAFYDRWAEMRVTVYSDESLSAMIQGMADEIDRDIRGIGSAARRNFARWSENPPWGGTFRAEIAHIIDWTTRRAAWMERRRLDGGLLPSPPVASLEIDREAGKVSVAFSSDEADTIHVTSDGSDPRGPGGQPSVPAYSSPLAVAPGAVLVARRFDGEHWSTPSLIETASLLSLMAYWSFNGETIDPDFALGSATLQLEPGAATEFVFGTGQDFTGENSRLGFQVGEHLRVNNPVGAAITVEVPTSGYQNIVVRYEARRSGQGAGRQTVEYTLDGETFQTFRVIEVENGVPARHTFDFSDRPGAGDNPNFGLRITFEPGDGGTAGNNRFDNFTVEGLPLPGTNPPPVLVAILPNQEIIAGDSAPSIDLHQHFSHSGQLSFSAASGDESVATAEIAGHNLRVEGRSSGSTNLVITAANEDGIAVSQVIRVLVYPAPHRLAAGDYEFDFWSPSMQAGEYPAHMLFLQSDRNDPLLDDVLEYAYAIPESDAAQPVDVIYPYAAFSRTRINALGSDGISFINTGRGRDLGGALLALDTRDAADIDVSWLAATIQPNEREYALRLRYRIGAAGKWSDLFQDGRPLEYRRQAEAGHTEHFGPIRLPRLLENQPLVQLKWRYYFLSGSGPRAELRLDDIRVTSRERPAVDPSTPAFRYYRWTPLATRGSSSVQLSEFTFYHDGEDILESRRADQLKDLPDVLGPAPVSNESPANLVDGDLDTKWFGGSNPAPLIFDFGETTPMDAYMMWTANDAIDRDPVSWTLEGSNDENEWILLDRVQEFPTPTTRFTRFLETDAFNLPTGAIVSRFHIGQAPGHEFTVIRNGESVTLEWEAAFAATVSLHPDLGEVATSGSLEITPAENADTDFTLVAVGIDDEPRTATVKVRSREPHPHAYRFLRFDLPDYSALRDSGAGMVQLSRFFFYREGQPVEAVEVTNPKGNNPSAEGPANLLGDQDAKWLDFHGAHEEGSHLLFDFGTVVEIDSYQLGTANDAAGRDPVRWRLYGRNSEDEAWVLIENMTPDYPMPTARHTLTPVIPLPARPEVGPEIRTFNDWRNHNFSGDLRNDPAVSGPRAAPLGDGVSNLIKYAFGLDPALPAGGHNLPRPVVTGDTLRLTYPERIDADDLLYTPQTSSRLTDGWNTNGIREVPPRIPAGDNEFEWVTVEIELGGTPRAFLRIQVTLPE